MFVVSPYADKYARDELGITTSLHYQARTGEIARTFARELTGSDAKAFWHGYTRTDADVSTEERGYQGRAILEYDPFHRWYTIPNSPDGPGLQFGKYRFWEEDRNIVEQEVWVPITAPLDQGLSKGDLETILNPCAAGHDSSSTSTSSPATSSSSSLASTGATRSTSGSNSGFTTTTSSTATVGPNNPSGFPAISVTQCTTSSCVNGQWIYNYLLTLPDRDHYRRMSINSG